MKVKLYCSTHDFQSKEDTIVELPDDLSEEELMAEAENFFWETKEPNWWFEIISS